MRIARTVMIRLIVMLALGLMSAGTLQTFAQADTDTREPVWSADMSVVDLGNGSIGAVRADLFSNVGGSAGLQAKWLWYYTPERSLRLAFTEGVPGDEDMTLEFSQDLALAFQPGGDGSFTWENVDVTWEDGQTIRVSIVRTADLDDDNPPTGAPTISGTAQVHETLTADTSDIADVDGLTNVVYKYQWITNGNSQYTEIPGATSSTYTPVAADVGRTIKVKVSFSDDADNRLTLFSASTAPVIPAPNTSPTGALTIDGTAQEGEELTANTSTIDDANGLDSAEFAYQWIQNDGNADRDIPDATSETYTLGPGDVGKTIKVRVSLTDDGGNVETLTSAPTVTVTAKPNTAPTGAPTISGTAQVHVTLTAGTSSIADEDGLDGATFTYQWIRNDGNADSDIASETSTTYTPVATDVGKTIKVKVFFTDDADNKEALFSEPTVPVVPAPNTSPTGAPTIDGTAQEGEELTANTSTIDDANGLDSATFIYQWIRNDGNADSDIADATSGSYTLEAPDVGNTIKVKVSFTDDGGNVETLTSAPTVEVEAAGAAPTASPGALEVHSGASRELIVSWGAPSTGPVATGYRVQWKSGAEDFDGSETSARQAVLTGISTLGYTITGLTNGSAYSVRVIAYNEHGDGPASAEETATPQPPNVIVIFADDLGYNDVSFNGATQIQTTNLDLLTAEGVTFTNGYVTSPVCSPSRAGLLTGRYPARFGMEANLAYNPFDQSLGLPATETLITDYLQDAGYHTGVVGKWHLGAARKFNPLRRGFDYFYGMLGGGHDYWEIDASAPEVTYLTPLLENKSPASFTGYLTDALTDKAIEFVKEDRGQPFFLYLPYNAPHSPFQAPEHLESKYSHITDSKRRAYLAMVDSVDQNVGRLLAALDQSGKRDNTIIFFLSDHGGVETGPMDNGELRDGKGSLYEGGLRVPFIASWPGRWPEGQTYDPMVISLDISATVLGLAKATVTDTTRPIDGVDLDPYLRGEQAGHPHQALFWRKATVDNDIRVVRSGNMKLMQVGSASPVLYDLAADIGEQDDLFSTQKATARELAALWNAWNQGNTKAAHIWGISNYEEEFEQLLDDYEQERVDWVDAQTRQQITIR